MANQGKSVNQVNQVNQGSRSSTVMFHVNYFPTANVWSGSINSRKMEESFSVYNVQRKGNCLLRYNSSLSPLYLCILIGALIMSYWISGGPLKACSKSSPGFESCFKEEWSMADGRRGRRCRSTPTEFSLHWGDLDRSSGSDTRTQTN